MVFAIITAWLAYKRAKEHGRSGILWAFIGAATFLGTQLAVSVVIGVGLGFGVEALGWSEKLYDDLTFPFTIVAVLASFFTSWLLLRWLGKTPQEEDFASPPPPPRDFNGGN